MCIKLTRLLSLLPLHSFNAESIAAAWSCTQRSACFQVKADKDDHHSDDHDEHLEKLQTHSVEHLKEVHKESK